MIKVKPGVTFGYAPAGFRILESLKKASKVMLMDFTITSGSDGVHSGPLDPHKTFEAYDIRTKDLTSLKKNELLLRLKADLGPRFYVFLESAGTANEHIHAQRRQNTTYDIDAYLGE